MTELIERHRSQLLEKGYHKDLVEAGLEWAAGSARGMAQYTAQTTSEQDSLFNRFLGRYLQEAETYIRKMAE